MRSALALLLLALLWPAVPTMGQDADPSTGKSIDDPSGDLESLVPPEAAGFVDIVHADIVPTEQGIDFRVQVADLATDPASGLSWELWLDFQYRESYYHFVIHGQTTSDVPDEVRRVTWGEQSAVLYRLEAGMPQLVRVPAFVDVAARTFNASMTWDAIQAPDGWTPQPGEPLRLREVATLWDLTLLASPHAGAPAYVMGASRGDKAVFPEGTFLSVPGAIGDLALSTPMPIRSSNGEATTFHWPVLVKNLGDRELDVTFDLEALGAEGRVPPGLRLAPLGNATINVYVTVPFNHDHGTTGMFPLSAKAGPRDLATLQLGVDYPSTPQPAGHHPDLWLHTSVERIQGAVDFNSGPLWMNTLEEDERANADLMMPREENCPIGPDIDAPQPIGPIQPPFDFGSYWEVHLDPALVIGLDGRMGESATLDLELVGTGAAPPGTFYGRLMLADEDFDGYGPFANRTDPFRASAPVAATPGPASLALHLDLPMPASLDLVAPSRVQNLVLALMLCLDAPAPAGIPSAVLASFAGITAQPVYAIRTGAHLHLAVDEYHDVLPLSPSSQGLALTVDEAVRRAAPGATVLFQTRLAFHSENDGEHAVRLFGTGTPHAKLRGPTTARGPDSVDLPVSFVVPDVPAGQVFDLLLDVTHAQDPARAVGLRLTVVVDPSETRDDAEQLASLPKASKESPSAPLGIAVLALALLALRRRR